MWITGFEEQGPLRVGVPIADLASGMYAALGVLTALLQREETGEGQWVRTSLLEAQIAMLDFQGVRWLIGNEVPPQAGNNHPTAFPPARSRPRTVTSTSQPPETRCGDGCVTPFRRRNFEITPITPMMPRGRETEMR